MDHVIVTVDRTAIRRQVRFRLRWMKRCVPAKSNAVN